MQNQRAFNIKLLFNKFNPISTIYLIWNVHRMVGLVGLKAALKIDESFVWRQIAVRTKVIVLWFRTIYNVVGYLMLTLLNRVDYLMSYVRSEFGIILLNYEPTKKKLFLKKLIIHATKIDKKIIKYMVDRWTEQIKCDLLSFCSCFTISALFPLRYQQKCSNFRCALLFL